MTAARAAKLDAGDEQRFTHRVVRRFRAGDQDLHHGVLIDASDFRNVAALESQRYLEALPASPLKVYTQQRARAEAQLEALVAEEERARRELSEAKAEEQRLDGSVQELQRAAARLAEERRALAETRTRVETLRLRLTGASGKAYDVDRTCIPSEKAAAAVRIAECDRLLAQLQGEVTR